MKNLLVTIISVVALVLSIVSLIFVFKTSNNSESRLDPIGKTATNIIYYVNIDSVAKNYTLVKDVQDELLSDQRRFEQQFQSKMINFQNRYAKVQEESAYMTKAELDKVQQQYEADELELQDFRQQLSFQLAEKEDKLRVRYTKNIRSFIESLNDIEQFDLVLGFNNESNVLFYRKENDITDLVIKGLNERYLKDKD